MKRISVIAPLYNEKDGIPMLAERLRRLAARLAPQYELECVLVDDGSQDGTTEEASKYFAWSSLVVQAIDGASYRTPERTSAALDGAASSFKRRAETPGSSPL